MGAEHTSGPWEYGPALNYEGFYIAPRGTRPTLAAVQKHRDSPETMDVACFNFPGDTEANARLIASAPSLLEACRLFAAWDTNPHLTDSSLDPVRKVVYAAIAEAQGYPAVSGGSPADPMAMPRAIEGRRQHDEGWATWRGQRRRDVP